MLDDQVNPKWKKFTIPVKLLCNGDYNRILKFVCWDYNKLGSRALIGEFQTTLNEIPSHLQTGFDLKNPKKPVWFILI